MKLRNKSHKTLYTVYAICAHTGEEKGSTENGNNRILYYVADEDLFGLGVEDDLEVDIVDNSLSSDFKFHRLSQRDGFMLLWDHFTDIDHLAQLIDLEPDVVAAFEKARKERPI